ncbi:MAG: YdeI/OmpD-associated family protein [Ignavibacteriae bacterium]|nr:YdeI/OmpD-associated family protein [Ignavibacteriota bacterium]
MINNILFFKNSAELRKWFEKNHETEKELLLGFYKVQTKKPTVTWSDSVDVAICFGWIDGIRRSINEESYYNRFTPRNPKSNWSAVNIDKFEKLSKLGLVHKKGFEAFDKKTVEKSKIYSYERKNVKLSKEFENEIKKNKIAWEYFSKLPPSAKHITIYWVMSAKREETQKSRLKILIESSEQNLRIPVLRR